MTRFVRPQWTLIVAGLAVLVFGGALLLYVNGSSPPGRSAAPGASPTAELLVPSDPASTPPSVAPSPSRAPSASPGTPGTVLWRADPALGPRAFEGVETAPGTVTVANDPQGRYGSSYRYETWQNADGTKARCESRGMREPNGSVLLLDSAHVGQTFYLGWRALWSPLPTQSGAWVSLFQLHIDGIGPNQPGAGPFVLRTLGDGQLHFQLTSPDGSDRHIWNAPLPVDTWSSFVIGFRLSRGSDGWIQFWYNGVPQRFTNGSTTYPAATLWGTHVNVKWGIYRSGANHTGHAVAYLNHAELGTSYAAVAP